MFNIAKQSFKTPLFVISVFTFGLLSIVGTPSVNAQSQVSLYPGQVGVFTLKYINAGDSDAIASAITTVSLNDKLEYVPGYLNETFGGGTTYCIADAIGGGIVSVAGSTTTISYRPRSSTTTSATCGGLGTAGAASITAAPEATPGDQTTWPAAKTGVITFRARLKDNQGLNAGDIVNFAIIGETTLDGGSGGAASLKVGVQAVPSNALVTADIPGLTLSCNPAQVNSTTTCNFTLPTSKSLPSNFTLSIGDSGVQSSPCVANGTAVTCNSVPTGSQIGQQVIFGKIGADPKTDSGEKATILSVPVVLPRTGGEGYILAGAVIISGLLSGILYLISRKKKVKVN